MTTDFAGKGVLNVISEVLPRLVSTGTMPRLLIRRTRNLSISYG